MITIAEYWIWSGLGVALVFLTVGIDRVEPNARGSYIFRPLLIPGVVLLWPLVLWRWFVLETGRDVPHCRHQPPRHWHRVVWLALAVLIPVILITGVLILQDRESLATPPVQLTDPNP